MHVFVSLCVHICINVYVCVHMCMYVCAWCGLYICSGVEKGGAEGGMQLPPYTCDTTVYLYIRFFFNNLVKPTFCSECFKELPKSFNKCFILV